MLCFPIQEAAAPEEPETDSRQGRDQGGGHHHRRRDCHVAGNASRHADGRNRSSVMRVIPWLYEVPPDVSALVSSAGTAILMVWAGRDIYRGCCPRPAARKHQHEHAGKPWNRRGICLFGLRHDLRRHRIAQIYFDAVLLILGFLLLGKALEARAKRRALAAINALSRLRPATARRVVNGVETLVALEEVRIGDQCAGSSRRALPSRREDRGRPHQRG